MNMYKIVGTNNIHKFVALMNSKGISHEEALAEGIDEDTIHEIDTLARSAGIAIMVVPAELSESWLSTPPELAQQGGMMVEEKMYVFRSISGDQAIRNGVMVPVEYSEGKVELSGRPERESEISEDDISKLSTLLDSNIDFDTFIKSI